MMDIMFHVTLIIPGKLIDSLNSGEKAEIIRYFDLWKIQFDWGTPYKRLTQNMIYGDEDSYGENDLYFFFFLNMSEFIFTHGIKKQRISFCV